MKISLILTGFPLPAFQMQVMERCVEAWERGYVKSTLGLLLLTNISGFGKYPWIYNSNIYDWFACSVYSFIAT